ncbi:MAG: ATP-dependent endonuclease [Nocardiopsaceae bacterium]|nr:ATP-dependent endonuclease [Nocardiopsaceae bacterium]
MVGGSRVAVLVEGHSDRAAVLTVAARLGRDLDAAGVAVVPMGGATNIGHFASVLGPRGLGLRLAGLCDEHEDGDFRHGLTMAGLDCDDVGSGLERLGFFVCVADLEDELIRALGVAATEDVIASQGESRRLETFRKQPAQQGRPADAQLRRFMGTRSGAKERYASALASALDPARLPPPLAGLLAGLAL